MKLYRVAGGGYAVVIRLPEWVMTSDAAEEFAIRLATAIRHLFEEDE